MTLHIYFSQIKNTRAVSEKLSPLVFPFYFSLCWALPMSHRFLLPPAAGSMASLTAQCKPPPPKLPLSQELVQGLAPISALGAVFLH